jgi:signal transduction histidine kinase/CheY-like chemotaxis protein/predicted hydrocarbon binding protein
MPKSTAKPDQLRTVSVPDQIAPLFLKAQDYVRRYFADRVEDPEHSRIAISGERYILVRAASMSVEFFDLVRKLYQDRGDAEARNVARNLLFDIAHSIGKADARAFAAKMNVEDPIEKLSAGPIHFSFAGWAFVKIYPESRPSPDDQYYLVYDHPFSFEADAWQRAGKPADFPVCVMNAGYSSGWCEESFGLPLVAAEISCQACGDAQCRFIMAPPNRIEEHVARYVAEHGGRGRAAGDTSFEVPEYFQRKRMEEELQAAKEDLERRVQERTAELGETNRRLEKEIIERELAEEERRKVQVKLLHAQKLESLGVLSGGVAHDFNNLLVGILGNAGLAMQALPPDSAAREILRDIETAATRAAELTHQLLAYAGKGPFNVQPVDLSRLVEEMGNLLSSAVSKNAKLVYRLESGLPTVEADGTQIRQVVMNLITNASEAIGNSAGTISVTTGQVDADRNELGDSQLGAQLPEGRYVFFEVTDDGHGMHPATQARIFDPFFTTKFTGRGLGLAAVLGIVRAHRGAIRVISAPGKGTTMRVLLPGADAAAAAPAKSPGRVEPAAGATRTGRVLVVDDEETVRTVARRVLESRGFPVRTADGGVSAIQMVREDPQAVDIVLLDMTMPDMSGAVTLDELLRIRPDLPVVLSSGYSQSDAMPARMPAAAGFIQKPYRPNDLVEAIRKALP